MTLKIYTDGGCHPNPGPGGWAFVVFSNDGVIHKEFGSDSSTTNNRMEMMAIIRALEFAGQSPCEIFSDSQLCVNTLNQWASAWEKKGWKRKEGEIKNLDLVKQAFSMKKQRKNAHIQWVRGHSGNIGNEMADELATKGRRAAAGAEEQESNADSTRALPYDDVVRQRDELLAALEFYAEGHHFILHDANAWETVSGEPQNFQEDEANTATVEDGSVARAAIASVKGGEA